MSRVVVSPAVSEGAHAKCTDIYTPILGQSPVIDEMLGRIQTRVERELGFQKELMKLRGALDMTLAQVSIRVLVAVGVKHGRELMSRPL